jgi:hypothetical protein
MKNLKLLLMAMGLLAFSMLNSCKKEAPVYESKVSQAETKTFYCEKVDFCHGTIQSFVTLDAENKPMSLGMRFSESVLKNLPTDPLKNVSEASLNVPKEAKDIGIDHIELGWNPKGHEPDHVYTLPHFDLHFYKATRQEQASVIPGPDPIIVSPKYIPTDYISTGSAVPNMGVHYVDLTAPEFNKQTFEKTFIYGFYQGKMTFLEPMFTRSFLLTKPDFTAPVKQPESFQKSGYYPTSYRISFDDTKKEYVVALEGFIYHKGV